MMVFPENFQLGWISSARVAGKLSKSVEIFVVTAALGVFFEDESN